MYSQPSRKIKCWSYAILDKVTGKQCSPILLPTEPQYVMQRACSPSLPHFQLPCLTTHSSTGTEIAHTASRGNCLNKKVSPQACPLLSGFLMSGYTLYCDAKAKCTQPLWEEQRYPFPPWVVQLLSEVAWLKGHSKTPRDPGPSGGKMTLNVTASCCQYARVRGWGILGSWEKVLIVLGIGGRHSWMVAPWLPVPFNLRDDLRVPIKTFCSSRFEDSVSSDSR